MLFIFSMERLKLLTSDAIKKFITDNQQYYVDFKREIESKFKVNFQFDVQICYQCV